MNRILSFALLIAVLGSCNNKPTCKNSDPVFDQYGPTDQPYKEEVLRRVQYADRAKTHYIIDKYIEFKSKPYVSLYVHTDSFCAQLFIDLKNPNKMAHFKTVKGLSFSGTEITGLQYQADTTNGKLNFVFEEGYINGKKQ